MNDASTTMDEAYFISPSERLALEVGIMAGRLAALLRGRFQEQNNPLADAVAFLEYAYQRVAGDVPVSDWTGCASDRRDTDTFHPIDRLALSLDFSPCELDMVILAGLAEEHEGYADIFRSLHPLGHPRPTTGLAAQLFCLTPSERVPFRRLLESGPAFQHSVIVQESEGPLFTRSLTLADRLWSVLYDIDVWPDEIRTLDSPVALYGLQHWLQQAQAVKAQHALQRNMPCTILVNTDDDDVAFQRAVALVHSVGVPSIQIRLPGEVKPDLIKLIKVHALARGVVPVLRIPHCEGPQRCQPPSFSDYPAPVVLCAQTGIGKLDEQRPLITVTCERISATALREMWSKTLPCLAEQAAALAARYPLEPAQAQQVAMDLEFVAKGEERKPQLADVASSIRSRANTLLRGGVNLVRPVATWKHLVLPELQMAQLREAVNRLYLQARVLDEWCFLEGRSGARGVRMLFAGPPGTGKTLSAEVLASALDVDLLIVDLSRVVSKWIGETEKNLAEVFDTAEQAKAVLLFDEADALFGKRTEVSDAHDRYANLETAYLLSRLERFEGLTVLSTNLRQNIDTAFIRRLEFIVEYEEPGREQRLALWRTHLPDHVPLAADVNLEELAAHFSIVGGLIRNAAVAAAFLAASQNTPIGKDHFVRAIRREYEKAGKSYRDLPKGFMKTVKEGDGHGHTSTIRRTEKR